MLKFNRIYFALALLLFFTEVLIALYAHDAYIRPYGGDFLVVILVYCFVKSFVPSPVNGTIIGVLLFAYMVEVSQYFHLIKVLGWQHSGLAKAILGTGFAWVDLLMYTMGALLIWVVEKKLKSV